MTYDDPHGLVLKRRLHILTVASSFLHDVAKQGYFCSRKS